MKVVHCNCGRKIHNSTKSGKCVSCSKIGNKNRYIDGRTNNSKCIYCGKNIWFGYNRCLSCARKRTIRPNFRSDGYYNGFFGKYHSLESKSKMSLSLGGTGIPYENALYPSDFSSELKEQIRQRDNHTCQNCGMTEEEHIIVWGELLTVHHIDYNKKNNNKTNLISTCRSCNIRANYNRNYWQIYYNEKVIILENSIIKKGEI